jgi:hypothetical protein
MIRSAISANPLPGEEQVQESNPGFSTMMKIHQCADAGVDRLEQISAFQKIRTILNKDA